MRDASRNRNGKPDMTDRSAININRRSDSRVCESGLLFIQNYFTCNPAAAADSPASARSLRNPYG